MIRLAIKGVFGAIAAGALVITLYVTCVVDPTAIHAWDCEDSRLHEACKEKAPPTDPDACLPMDFDMCAITSNRAIGDFVVERILANHRAYGHVPWDCMIAKFEAQHERAVVKVLESPRRPERHSPGDGPVRTYRFNVDKSDLPIYIPMPGLPNGLFTAILAADNPDEIALVYYGDYEWLKFE